jgi:Fe-S cluster assembly iron-binding protein IscA
MKIPINYFKNANMADVWVGKYCIENNIEIICLKHDEGYIKYIPQKTTIYNDESKSDKIQTDLVNGLFAPKIVETKIVETKIAETKIEDQNFEKQIELKNSIVLTQKQINYEKINSIFNFNNPNIVSKEKQEKQIINLKLNTSTHSKMFPKKKKR